MKTKTLLPVLAQVVLFTFLYSSDARAQEGYPYEYEPVVSRGPSEGYYSFGDINGDGVIDLIAEWGYFAPRGGSRTGATFYQGHREGTFSFWKTWEMTPPPSLGTVFGDWKKDGRDDLLVSANYQGIILVEADGEQLTETQVSSTNYLRYQEGKTTGDFDGDGFLDIAGKNHHYTGGVFFGKGDGTFTDTESSLPFGREHPSADFNGDRMDDVVLSSENQIAFWYGAAIRENVFMTKTTLPVPFTAVKSKAVDINTDGAADLYIASATEYLFLLNDKAGNFQPLPMTLPFSIEPNQVLFADIDRDGRTDLLSWKNGTITILRNNGQSGFSLAKEVPAPFITVIKDLYVSDMDRDGREDILVFHYNGPSVTLLSRSLQPTPTPTISTLPTATPTPTLPPTATPTPFPSLPGVINVDPSMNLMDVLKNAPSGSTVLLAPGLYGYSGAGNPEAFVKNKTLHLAGQNPDRSADIKGQLVFENSTVIIQNLTFEPYPPSLTGFGAENSNLTLINNRFIGSIDRYDYSMGTSYPGGPTLAFRNAEGKSLTLIGNQVEAGSALTTLSIFNCRDCTLSLADNPHFGVEGVARIKIGESQNLQLFLNGSEGLSLTNLSVVQSTLDVFGGRIVGTHGIEGVIGGNGGDGINATKNTHIVLHETEVLGGRGGDGIEPGLDGVAVRADETSRVEWATVVREWSIY